MEKITMQIPDFVPTKYNRGQRKEFIFRHYMTGRFMTADNVHGADLVKDSISYSIKSSHATVCYGYQFERAIEFVSLFAFVMDDEKTAYIMTREEFVEFIANFHEFTRDSSGKNGGQAKTRVKRESAQMRAYLESHI